jgi:hypothetical protein
LLLCGKRSRSRRRRRTGESTSIVCLLWGLFATASSASGAAAWQAGTKMLRLWAVRSLSPPPRARKCPTKGVTTPCFALHLFQTVALKVASSHSPAHLLLFRRDKKICRRPTSAYLLLLRPLISVRVGSDNERTATRLTFSCPRNAATIGGGGLHALKGHQIDRHMYTREWTHTTTAAIGCFWGSSCSLIVERMGKKRVNFFPKYFCPKSRGIFAFLFLGQL